MIIHLVDGTYELFRHFYGDAADVIREFRDVDQRQRRGKEKVLSGSPHWTIFATCF